MLNVSCEEFIEKLSSSEPVPGGGGASALAASLGAALGAMVCNLTLGKKKYADVQEEVQRLVFEINGIRKELEEAVQKDAEAFLPLSKAYSLPKDTPGRDAIMEAALLTAATVPMEMIGLCLTALKKVERIGEVGSRIAISDAGVAAALLRSGIEGAALNVYINTKYMKDRIRAEELNAKTDAMTDEGVARAEAVYSLVKSALKSS